MRTQHTRAASASGSACVDILFFTVKNHQSAIIMNSRNINIFLCLQQFIKKLTSHISEVTRQNKVIFLRLCACVCQKIRNGSCRGRGKCQEKTIKFFKTLKVPILLGFRHFNYGCSYGVVAMKGRL